ncbi:hypothetical protein ACHQM5_024417 [Ranunculus cassubicifolius]
MVRMRSCVCISVLQNCRCRMQLIKASPIIVEPISHANIWLHGIGESVGRRFSVKPILSGSTNKHQSKEVLGPGLWAEETKRLLGRLKQQEQHKTRDIFIQKNNVAAIPHTPKEQKYSQRVVTFIVFDFETSGMRREVDRIIEIGLRDLNGGENSTFHTLINPECCVLNSHIHGISTQMVNQSNVPRFKDLLPILKHYIKSRQIPDTPILLVSHNAWVFDVPFLVNEFARCDEKIPSDWLFLDTLPLARELAKLKGTEKLTGKSVRALREYYKIPLVGQAHNAMSDVHSLTRIFQELTNDLKLPVRGLLERSFNATDLINAIKNKEKKKEKKKT